MRKRTRTIDSEETYFHKSDRFLIGFDRNTMTGLSEQEAIARLKGNGYDELPLAQARNFLAIAWETVLDPIFLLLIGGGVVYWILGSLLWT